MRFCLLKRSRVGSLDQRDRCRGLGMLWTIVDKGIWASMGSYLLGAIEGRVVRMYGFGWIEEWLQLSGF